MRSNFSAEFYVLGVRNYRREESEIKNHLSKMLSHIDYMLFKVDAGFISDRRQYYFDNFNVPILRKMLEKSLIKYVNAEKYRDSKTKLRKRKREYKRIDRENLL